MRKNFLGIFSIIAWFVFFLPFAKAQAPSSVVGDGFLVSVTSGTPPLASYGYYIFLTANSGNTYQTIGVYGVSSGVGTYSYAATSSTVGQLNISDTTDGYTLTGTANFSSSYQGSFNVSTVSPVAGYYQYGYFSFASINAPASLAGKTVVCTISDGLTPFAYTGSFSIQFAASGNTYTVLGDGVHTVGSTGTYSYSLANRSTGKVQINDSLAGAFTVYLGCSDPSHGGYAITRSPSGFQIGSFTILDTTPPTVSISSPASARTYLNSQTVTITATAADDIAIAEVDFYDGATLRGSASSAPYSFDWAFTDADNGIHSWTARAYDTSGNSTASSAVSLTVSVDTIPPTVSITNPSSGQVVNSNSVTVAGTAVDPGSPTTGVAGVEVRINGGGWSAAVGTTTWSKAVSFNLGNNAVEARSHDNAGNYSAISSNLVTFADTNKPTIAMTAPTAGQRWSNAVFTVKGTATDNVQVTNVWYQLNGGNWNVAATTNNWTNWQAPVVLIPSTNVVRAYAVDSSGNNSITSTQSIQYVVVVLPVITADRQGDVLTLSWPTNDPAFYMEVATNKSGMMYWSSNAVTVSIVNGRYTSTRYITNNFRFWRLRK